MAQRDGNDNKRRVGHKGWLLGKVVREGVISIEPCKWSVEKLAEYPQPLIWPIVDDFAGARKLIDAVMDRNAEMMRSLIKRFPEYNLGLGDYVDRMEERAKKIASVHRKVIKRIHKMGMDTEIAIVMDPEVRKEASLVITITRGMRLIASKVVACVPFHPQNTRKLESMAENTVIS
jgi:hypothetical protein